MSREKTNERGFTIVEMTVVMAISVPLLMGVAMTTSNVNKSAEANSRSSDVIAYTRRMSQRIAKLARPAKLSTITMKAVAEDVTAGRAKTVGEWIVPTDLVWRPGLKFRAASGLLSMNAALSTEPRGMEFSLDASEKANGVDDDGDGLVDEGTITVMQNSINFATLRNVEECAFMLDGRTLNVKLRVARRASDHRVYRAYLEKKYYLRNN